MTRSSKEEIASALRCTMAVADAIREAGEIPAGHLYAALSQHGCSQSRFESIVGLLTRRADGVTPLVERRGDLLVWKGSE